VFTLNKKLATLRDSYSVILMDRILFIRDCMCGMTEAYTRATKMCCRCGNVHIPLMNSPASLHTLESVTQKSVALRVHSLKLAPHSLFYFNDNILHVKGSCSKLSKKEEIHWLDGLAISFMAWCRNALKVRCFFLCCGT
jgi:hypothetical protein